MIKENDRKGSNMDEKEKNIEGVPEELYAPLGNVTFQKPQETKEESVEAQPEVKKEEVEPEILSYKDVKLEYAEKPINTAKIIKTIVILVVVALFLVAGYLFEKNNKNVLRKGLTSLASDIEDIFYDVRESSFFSFQRNKPFRTSFLLSFDTTYDETKISEEEKDLLKFLNDVTVSQTLDIDHANQTFTHNFKSTYLGGNILEVYGNGTSKQVTFKIEDVLGKYIAYPISNLKRIYVDSETDQKEWNELKSIVVKTLFANIEEKDLTREKKKIKIADQTITVYDVALKMDSAYLQKLLKKTVQELKTNESFIEKTMNYTNLTQTRLKELLDIFILSIEDTKIIDDSITFHTLIKGLAHKVIGYELEINNNLTVTYYHSGKLTEGKIIDNQQQVFFYQSDLSDTEEYKYQVKYQDNLLTISRFIKKDTTLYDYKLTNSSSNYYTGSFVIMDEETSSSKDGNIRLTIQKFDKNHNEVADLYTTLNYSVKKTETIKSYEDEEAVAFSSLSEADKKEIARRVENTEYFKLLKEKISAYLKLEETKEKE